MLEWSYRGKCRIACVCLSMLMLCGCMDKPTAPSTQPTTGTVSGVTEPSDPVPTQPPPPETIPPITEPPLDTIPEPGDPVTVLESTKWVTFPELLSLGHGTVLANRSYYDRRSGKFISSMEVVDVIADRVRHQIVNDSPRELVPQHFTDGTVMTADPKTNTFYVYDEALRLLDSFSAPDVDGYFSYDRQSYFYLDSGMLMRMALSGGDPQPMEIPGDLRFHRLVGIHPTEDLLIAQVYLSAYTDDHALALIDVQRGVLRMLTDRLSHVWLTGDTFYGVGMNQQSYGMDVYTGTLSGTQVTKLEARKIGDDQMGWSVMPGSHLLVRRFAPDDDPRNTCIFDLKNGTMVDLDTYGYIDCTFGATWLYEEQLILGFYEEGDYFIPVVIDPKALTFGEGPEAEPVAWTALVDDALIQRYRVSAEGEPLDASLAAVRETADALEQRFGVTVKIGGQIQPVCYGARKTAQTVTDPGQIASALTMLETELAKYPQGFFSAFRNGVDEGGIAFCLTGAIEGDLPSVGFASLARDTYALGLDITAGGLDATIHHEIWHAMEMRLSTDSFDTEGWAKCNPDGYKYYGKYDTGYLDLTKWTWSNGSGSDSRFVDSYSRINAREDRARIWEKVMSTDASALLEAKAIREKLQIMVDTMGTAFPTGGVWEDYL